MEGTLLVITIGSVVAMIVMALILARKGNSEEGRGTITLLQQQIQELTRSQNEKLDRTVSELNTRLQEQNKLLNDQLGRSNKSFEQQFATTSKIVKDITQEITSLNKTNKEVVGFAEQLQSLENILKNPKRRGILGEYYLERALSSVLPTDAFSLQYKFSNGEIVDAVVHTKEGLIPVDAKFSLENYNRLTEAETEEERQKYQKVFKQDLMNRIDETAKYIRPGEGTLDFAFMFIPADGLYHDLLVEKIGALDVNQTGLIEYAFKKRVLIVSPTTFFAYLQTVLQGLRALKIEESTKEIQKQVEKLQRHLRAYEEHMSRLGKHLGTTVGAYNNAAKEFTKIDKDMIQISGGTQIQLDVDTLERPQEIVE